MHTQFTQYYQPVFRFLKNRVGNEQDAEDLVQEVFLKAHKSKSTPTHLKSWLFTIAHNTLVDHYRKNDSAKLVNFENEVPIEIEAVEEEQSANLLACVVAYLPLLPRQNQKIVELTHFENVPQKDIALALDMPYSTVKSILQRSRKKLKALIESCCHIFKGNNSRACEANSVTCHC